MLRPGAASYGIDAPGVPFGLISGGVILLGVSVLDAALGTGPGGIWGPLTGSSAMFASAALYLHATLRGKFRVWDDLLDGLHLRGDEHVLDLGCGRGLVLIGVAKRLTGGRAVGFDLWRSVDQSGNRPETTLDNARAEGVADRVEVETGDMTALPFEDASFDVLVSSLAIHNIPSGDGRQKAVDEAARVLRPGGRLMIADIMHTTDYEARLKSIGLRDVSRRPLGWRLWYGGPWMKTTLVTAAKPGR
jgi:arsenite methyltransferase